jgi:hypothetical protein
LGQVERQAGFNSHGSCGFDAFLFADRTNLPAEYRGDAFATMHGSWNRNPPSGYEIVRIRFENGQRDLSSRLCRDFYLRGVMESGVASRDPSA